MKRILSLMFEMMSKQPYVLVNLLLWYVFEMIVISLPKYALTTVMSSDNVTNYNLVFLVVTKLFSQMACSLIKKRTMKISQDACYDYKKYKLCDYRDNISQESKEIMGIGIYAEKVENLCGRIDGVMEHFIPNLITTLSSFSITIFTFGKTDLWILIIVISIQLASLYLFYIPTIILLDETNIKFKKMRRKAINWRSFALYNYDMGFEDYTNIENQDSIIIGTHKDFTHMTNNASNIVSYTNIITLGIVLLLVSHNIKAVIVIVTGLTTDINGIIGCASWLLNVDVIVGEFYDMENKFIRREKPIQKSLDDTFVIDEIKIKRGKREICYGVLNKKIHIRQGSRCLIRGSSGHGKSTFFKALCGQLAGVQVNGEDSGHFMDNIISLGQSSGSFLKFNELSLTEIFCTSDENIIVKFCKMVMLEDWLNKLKIDAGKNFMNQTVKLSGGESQRLTIGYKLFQAEKLNKPIIALDEPECGTDLFDTNSNDGYEMIKRISEGFKKTTIIIISHMYNNKGEAHVTEVRNRAVKWDHVITVDNFNIDTW